MNDIIYEILLWVDVKTLINYHLTHKHTYDKYFWVKKFNHDLLPLVDDLNLYEYYRMYNANRKTLDLYQLIREEKEKALIYIILNSHRSRINHIFPFFRDNTVIDSIYIMRDAIKFNLYFYNIQQVFHYTSKEATKVLTQLFYYNDELIVMDKNRFFYHPVKSTGLNRKIYWKNKGY